MPNEITNQNQFVLFAVKRTNINFIGICLFYIITKEVQDGNNELLLNRSALIEQYLKSNDAVALDLITKSGEAQIKTISKSNSKVLPKSVFKDTLILDKKENELAPNRMITSKCLL